ncbi:MULTISPECIES: siderophore-interacting protein [Streptomyces]|uniref:siderophore-interacting protein n=1 Tax=Streptomyces TaxID=1883 RepID=UPI000B410D84|nr:siderophore-interacting protein [Streptomyces sp. CS113]OWA13288.1 hypothetical protein B9W62_00775 [Streptomyces sp. CS113]
MTVPPTPTRGPVGLTGRPARLFSVHVARNTRLTPHMIRVTLRGESLTAFVGDGPDQRIKLLLPRHPSQSLDALHSLTPRQMRELPDAERPVMRTYTIRSHDPSAGEVEIDFALHTPVGPATRWAIDAVPGQPAAFFGSVAAYDPPADTGWQLVVGDDTALPAVAAILESPSAPATTHAYVSVTDASAVLPLTTRVGTTVTWLPRDGGSGSGDDDHGASLVSAVRRASLPTGPGYVWLAAEQSVARDIRAHLVHERGMDRERVYFSGYWSRGRAEGE